MIVEFLLFGVIEVFILLMFYKYVGDINNVKMWHGIILCILFYAVGLINFPFVKQIGMIVVMIIYLFVLNNKINVKIVLMSSLYLLCIEILFSIFYELLLIIDLSNTSLNFKFLYMIPIRLTEVGLILLYRRSKINGLDVGGRSARS